MSKAVDSPSGAAHTWRFTHVGGLDMVRIETAADLVNIEHLDQKLWTALACPVKGLEFDEKTLTLIDVDKDDRVRAPEVIAAVKWACAALKDPGLLLAGADAAPLSAIGNAGLEGAARTILHELGKGDAVVISLADVEAMASKLAQTRFNGDGIVTADSAGDDAVAAQLISDIVATQGGMADRSGKPGVNAGMLGAFFDALAAFETWTRQGDTAKIRPLGADTDAAVAALEAVRKKIDDFFGRCRLAAFDGRATAAMNRQESEYLELAARDLSITAQEIAGFPLAHIESGRTLPLADGINPAWLAAMERFRTSVVRPVLGGDVQAIDAATWDALKKQFAPFSAWMAAKAGASVEQLGLDRVRGLLAGDGRSRVEALIAEDLTFASQFASIGDVEKLLRFSRDLCRLLNNFVAFTDFYDPDQFAVFQAGTLYMDGRACILVTPVADAGKHATLAGMSKAHLVYCKCTRPSGETRQVVAAFTNGDSDHLIAGRNGLFYDRKGRDWDAEIVKVVDNPISVRQAFFAPYKKFVRMLEDMAAKRAATADAASDARLASTASSTVAVDQAAPQPTPKKIDVGTVAAIGVAASAAVAVLTAIVGGILGLGWWQIPLAVIGVLLLISGPSMVIAALKLRQRTLGPILDANGWAINSRVKINIPFGASLTALPELPKGAQRSMSPLFGEKKPRWLLYAVILILIAAAVWVRWDRGTRGHYFWQTPVVEVEKAPEQKPETTD